MTRLKRPLGPVLITIWASFAGCAIQRGGSTKAPPNFVVEAAQSGDTDRMQAIAEMEDYLKASPTPEETPWVMAWAGEQRRLAGDDERAQQWWEMVNSSYPEHFVASTAALGLAVMNSREDPQGNVLATLQLIESKGQPDSLNADRFRILARVAAMDGASSAEIDSHVEKALHYAQQDEQVLARVTRMLEDLIPEDIEPVIRPEDPEEATALAIQAALRDDDFALVIEKGQTFIETWPESEHAPRMSYLVKRAQAGDPTQEGQITVMLPLSGKYKVLGEQLKQLIEMANSDVSAPLTLLFVDTVAAQTAALEAGDTEFDQDAHLRELTEKAVLESGSVAILGPLMKEHALVGAPVAQDLGVPMLSLSRAQGTAETGDYVFRGQLSDASQVRSLVQHAVTDRGLQRLALVHPANPYGDEMRALFMAAVEAEGGELVQIVSYDPTANDFRTVAQELGQKDYTVRALEFKEMKKEAERRGLKSDKLVLPPIIEFDGIFIADNWKRSAAIASGLAYEEFPVGDFLPNKHTPIIPLMGLNSWHDARITELGGSFIQHAVFVDAFSSVHSGDAAHEWVAYYQESFNGQKPKVLHAVTWDTTRLLASAVLAGGPDRQDIRDSLGQVELLDSVAAGGRFGDNREIARELLFLTIEGEDIVPWTSPEDEEPSGEAIAP